MNKTGYFTHPSCRQHEMGRGHPECPERLDAIEDRLLISGLDVALDRREAPAAPLADIELAHDRMFVASLRDGTGADQSTGLFTVSPKTASCTLRNGRGVNPVACTCATLPVLGTTWDVDSTSGPNTFLTFRFGGFAPLVFIWLFLNFIARDNEVRSEAKLLREEIRRLTSPDADAEARIQAVTASLRRQTEELKAASDAAVNAHRRLQGAHATKPSNMKLSQWPATVSHSSRERTVQAITGMPWARS